MMRQGTFSPRKHYGSCDLSGGKIQNQSTKKHTGLLHLSAKHVIIFQLSKYIYIFFYQVEIQGGILHPMNKTSIRLTDVLLMMAVKILKTDAAAVIKEMVFATSPRGRLLCSSRRSFHDIVPVYQKPYAFIFLRPHCSPTDPWPKAQTGLKKKCFCISH